MEQYVCGPGGEEKQADVAVYGKEGGVQAGKVRGLDERVLPSEQPADGGKAGRGNPPQVLDPGDSHEQRKRQNVERRGNGERAFDSEAPRNGMEAGGAVEFEVLAGVKDVEAAHPERHSGSEQ